MVDVMSTRKRYAPTPYQLQEILNEYKKKLFDKVDEALLDYVFLIDMYKISTLILFTNYKVYNFKIMDNLWFVITVFRDEKRFAAYFSEKQHIPKKTKVYVHTTPVAFKLFYDYIQVNWGNNEVTILGSNNGHYWGIIEIKSELLLKETIDYFKKLSHKQKGIVTFKYNETKGIYEKIAQPEQMKVLGYSIFP